MLRKSNGKSCCLNGHNENIILIVLNKNKKNKKDDLKLSVTIQRKI